MKKCLLIIHEKHTLNADEKTRILLRGLNFYGKTMCAIHNRVIKSQEQAAFDKTYQV